jgi:hypothetical protein
MSQTSFGGTEEQAQRRSRARLHEMGEVKDESDASAITWFLFAGGVLLGVAMAVGMSERAARRRSPRGFLRWLGEERFAA